MSTPESRVAYAMRYAFDQWERREDVELRKEGMRLGVSGQAFIDYVTVRLWEQYLEREASKDAYRKRVSRAAPGGQP